MSIHANQRDDDCTKPVHMGAFVLSYSRVITTAHRKRINSDGTRQAMEYYGDTDAMFILASQAKFLPFGKHMGCMSNNIAHDGPIIKFLGPQQKWITASPCGAPCR